MSNHRSGLSRATLVRLSELPVADLQAELPVAPDLIGVLAPSARPTLRVSDVATLLGVSVGSVRRWVDDGALESYRLPGGERRFTPEQVHSFLEVSKAS
jgi:excisionase family DNA binding protein